MRCFPAARCPRRPFSFTTRAARATPTPSATRPPRAHASSAAARSTSSTASIPTRDRPTSATRGCSSFMRNALADLTGCALLGSAPAQSSPRRCSPAAPRSGKTLTVDSTGNLERKSRPATPTSGSAAIPAAAPARRSRERPVRATRCEPETRARRSEPRSRRQRGRHGDSELGPERRRAGGRHQLRNEHRSGLDLRRGRRFRRRQRAVAGLGTADSDPGPRVHRAAALEDQTAAGGRLRGRGRQPRCIPRVQREVTIAAGAPGRWVDFSFPSPTSLPTGSYWLGYWFGPIGGGARISCTNGIAGIERYRPRPTHRPASRPSRGEAGTAQPARYALFASGETSLYQHCAADDFGERGAGSDAGRLNGSWSGGPTDFSYQWRRCSSSGAGCRNIPGATGQTYVLGAADVGQDDPGGRDRDQRRPAPPPRPRSRPRSSRRPSPPANTALPRITGTANAGTDPECGHRDVEQQPDQLLVSVAPVQQLRLQLQQHLRCHRADLPARPSDAGRTIRVVVTATNAGGSASATSNQTAVVQTPSPPANTALPTITGTATQGQTLSAAPGRGATARPASRISGAGAAAPAPAAATSPLPPGRATRPPQPMSEGRSGWS